MGWSHVVEFRPTFIAIRDNVESIKARKSIYRMLLDALSYVDGDDFDELIGVDEVLDEVMERMDLIEMDEDEYYLVAEELS